MSSFLNSLGSQAKAVGQQAGNRVVNNLANSVSNGVYNGVNNAFGVNQYGAQSQNFQAQQYQTQPQYNQNYQTQSQNFSAQSNYFPSLSGSFYDVRAQLPRTTLTDPYAVAAGKGIQQYGSYIFSPSVPLGPTEASFGQQYMGQYY